MELKHTPGPWRAGSGTGGKGSVVSDQLAVGALNGSDAIEYYGGNLIAESVAPENIQLIAAAPELLAALVALTTNPHGDLGDMIYQVREREGLGWDGPAVSAWNDAVTAARAAVAKATGSAA